MPTKADEVNKAAILAMRKILSSDCPKDTKYQELDDLQLWIMREHPDGLTANVVQTIADAQTKVLYPEWKGGLRVDTFLLKK